MNLLNLKNRKAILLLASREISIEWSLTVSMTERLCKSVSKLKPTGLYTNREHSALYKGILLRAGRKRILVMGKKIIVYESSVFNVFYDRSNYLEKALYHTAPKGLFPEYVKMKIGILRRKAPKYVSSENFTGNYSIFCPE